MEYLITLLGLNNTHTYFYHGGMLVKKTDNYKQA